MVHPALDSEGTLYFACNQPTSKFFAVNPDGTEKWSHEYKDKGLVPHISAPAITPDNSIIYAVGGTCKGSGNSFINCNKGLLVKTSPHGTVHWEREIKTETPTSPALGPDGTIYLSSWQLAPGEAKDHGRLAAYEPEEGYLKWSFKTAGSIFPPVVGGDGTVYQVTYQDQSDKSKRRKAKFDSEEFYYRPTIPRAN